ncbi:MAG TPA: proprotein convertase P-domain-containing protein, partial [Solirubrobacteraceae bacterium]|nr:proprotein convertase P-domain-containing protein [Solirubrobacteraceae bacterium]
SGGGAALPFLLRAGAPVAPSGTAWTPAAPNAAIPETYAGLSSTITVPGPGAPIQDLDLRIDQLAHGWLGDLRVYLSHDGGPRRALAVHPGRGEMRGGTLAGMVFDDHAGAPFASLAVGTAPVTGRYRPLAALEAFEGETTAGTWTLTVVDDWDGSTGTLGGWSLGFSTRSTGCEDNSAVAATGAAAAVGATAATIGGTVDAAGAATEYRIVWGETDAYGSSTPVVSAGAVRGAAARTTALTGLAPETTYHFRVEALRFGELASAGEDRTFTTTAVPPPPDPEPTPDPDPDPAPVSPEPVTPDPTPATPDPKPVAPDPVPVTPPTTNQPTDAGPRAPAGGAGGTGTTGGGSTGAATGGSGSGWLADPEITITPRPAALAFASSAKTVRVTGGKVTLRLTAPASARGTLTLRAGARTLGTARFTGRAASTTAVTVKLTASGRAALRKARGHKLAVTARATAAGRTATWKFTLRG